LHFEIKLLVAVTSFVDYGTSLTILIEIESLRKSLKLVKNKKNEMLLNFMEEFFVL